MKIVQVLFDQPGQSFNDISGKNLAITKTGTFKPAPPLTSRTLNSVFIDSSNSLTLSNIPIAVRSHEQESFSISFYIKCGSEFSDESYAFYDESNSMGFRISQSNISFTVSSDSSSHFVRHKLQSISKKIFVQAVYSKRVVSLFVDGVAKDQIELPKDFKFKSTSPVSLVASCDSSFIMLDKIEVFNEAVSQSYIFSEMFLDSVYQNPGQIMSVDDAAYFSFSSDLKPITTGFSYGQNKFLSTAEMYNVQETYENYVTIISGNSGYFTDSVFIPTVENTSHNQIDWYGDSGGIIVSYNTDGSDTYTELTNHSNIPGFTGGMLYYKVQLLRYGAFLKSPAFTGMSFVIYDSKSFSSDNTLYSLSTGFNYSVGHDTSGLIDQSSSNGISMISGGFSVDVDNARSVEFMFMPQDLSQACLVDCGDSRYSWSAAGNITKSNISSIYVNGVDLYSQASVSNVFTPGVLHHVVITFSSNQSSNVFINQSKTDTLVGPNSKFAHLGIYDYDMSAKAIKHYKYLSSRVSELIISEVLFLGQDSYSGFNVDKVVLSTQ
jgi:hypothetical protein